MSHNIAHNAIDLDATCEILLDALSFDTQHTGAFTVHQGTDRAGFPFAIVTCSSNGRSLVIRQPHQRQALQLVRVQVAANDPDFAAP